MDVSELGNRVELFMVSYGLLKVSGEEDFTIFVALLGEDYKSATQLFAE